MADAATRKRPAGLSASPEALRQIEKLLKDGDAVRSGELMLLGLDDVRGAIPASEWEQIEPHIHIAIERLMERLLGPGDRLVRLVDGSYLAIIVSRDFDGAVALMHHACHVLTSHFFGRESVGKVRFDALVSAMEKQGGEIVETREAVRVKGLAGPAGATRAPAAVDGEPQRAMPDISYLPVWDAYHNVLSTFMAGAWEETPSGRLVGAPEFADGQEGALEQARFDAHVLRESVAVLDDLYDNAFALLLALPVNHRTLASVVGRAIFADACREIPDHLRKLISFRLFDVPEDMSPHILADRVKPLKAFARAIGLQLTSWNELTERQAANPVFDMIAFDLTGRGGQDEMLMEALPRMVTLARQHHRLTGCSQIQNAAQLRLAKNAGAIFLSGPAVGGPCLIPGNMVRCTLAELPYEGV